MKIHDKLNEIIFSSATILIFAYCNTTKADDSLNIVGFISNEWIKDSLGCDDKRLQMVDSLMKHRISLTKKTIYFTKKYFGPPNAIDSSNKQSIKYYYFIEKGVQCGSDYSQSRLRENISVPNLYIFFDEKKLSTELGLSIPD